MPSRILVATLCAAALAACSPPPASDADSRPATAEPAPPGAAEQAANDADSGVQTPPATEPATDTDPDAAADFAPAPAVGTVLRANCRMGGCWWYRLDAVQREDVMPPRYALTVMVGDSTHGSDAYPESAEGVDIDWDDAPAKASVQCSRSEPLVRYQGQPTRLWLNPGGVFGAEQGVANLYFRVCHGESGDDGQLAAKYGYDLKRPD
ncbi:hypothetical protein [Luteimonas sp. e5]